MISLQKNFHIILEITKVHFNMSQIRYVFLKDALILGYADYSAFP